MKSATFKELMKSDFVKIGQAVEVMKIADFVDFHRYFLKNLSVGLIYETFAKHGTLALPSSFFPSEDLIELGKKSYTQHLFSISPRGSKRKISQIISLTSDLLWSAFNEIKHPLHREEYTYATIGHFTSTENLSETIVKFLYKVTLADVVWLNIDERSDVHITTAQKRYQHHNIGKNCARLTLREVTKKLMGEFCYHLDPFNHSINDYIRELENVDEFITSLFDDELTRLAIPPYAVAGFIFESLTHQKIQDIIFNFLTGSLFDVVYGLHKAGWLSEVYGDPYEDTENDFKLGVHLQEISLNYKISKKPKNKPEILNLQRTLSRYSITKIPNPVETLNVENIKLNKVAQIGFIYRHVYGNFDRIIAIFSEFLRRCSVFQFIVVALEAGAISLTVDQFEEIEKNSSDLNKIGKPLKNLTLSENLEKIKEEYPPC